MKPNERKLYAVHFEDDPAAQSVRDEQSKAHEQYLRDCGERIVNAGGLHREGSQVVVGGLWIVHGNSELDVRDLIESDPYFTNGLRRTIRIWQYSPSSG